MCGRCQLLWLDPGEQEVSPLRTPTSQDLVGPEDDGPAIALTGPDRLWKTLPAILGLPIEYGRDRLRSFPLVTWGITAVLAGVFLWLMLAGGTRGLWDAILGWGLIPNEWSRYAGLTLLTSFFLHAGWWHLVGNAYFFVIFGDNVEDHLGAGRFVLLLAGAHLCGMVLHAALAGHRGGVPCVGASAGICGVMAYYAVAFPRAKIGIFLWVFSLFHVFRVSAYVGLIAYVALQALGAYLTRGGQGGVAYLAHFGGLAVGAAAGWVSLARRRRRSEGSGRIFQRPSRA